MREKWVKNIKEREFRMRRKGKGRKLDEIRKKREKRKKKVRGQRK